ncbi:MAG: HEAT repeat domain-containing protein [Planctomycetes bacterium]|nr:HEAT repeat domain-containing protein [Planctomycetota bacterium]
MQQDDFEVTFCDLCGASVPAADLASGAATRTNDKTVGACCLAGLRAATPPSSGAVGSTRASAADSRLMLVAVVLLAAVAVATIFLDHRLATAETALAGRHAELMQVQRSDSEVLQTVGVDMDSVVRRADVDELGRGVKAIEEALRGGEERARQDLDQLRQEVGALRQELRTVQAAAIDYRPLFDDLRVALQRQAASLADLRATPAGAPREAAVPPEVAETPPAAPQATEDLGVPPALVEHVRRLKSDDPAVRFEAVDELARSKEPTVLRHLLPLVHDPDSFVRRVTMDGLAGFRAPDAVDALLIGLGDADENVRDTAWRSLREVTGQKFPFDAANPSKEVRARAQLKWQEWWDKNKATFGTG